MNRCNLVYTKRAKKQTRKQTDCQPNSVLHDNANIFTSIPKTIVKAQSNERNQVNKKQTRKQTDC